MVPGEGGRGGGREGGEGRVRGEREGGEGRRDKQAGRMGVRKEESWREGKEGNQCTCPASCAPVPCCRVPQSTWPPRSVPPGSSPSIAHTPHD